MSKTEPLQITPGPIEADLDALFDPRGTMVASTHDRWAGANATLYADAHNTTTPYQYYPQNSSGGWRRRKQRLKG